MRGLFWASEPQSSENDNKQSAEDTTARSNRESENQTLLDTFSPPKTRSAGNSQPSNSNKDWNGIINSTDWTQFSEPRTIIPTVLLTGGILFSIHVHRKYLRRIPEVANISPSLFRRRSLLGRVTSVGDGDNFRLYHTPGGRLAGWDWLRKVPTSKKELRNRTVRYHSSFIRALNIQAYNLFSSSLRFTYVSLVLTRPNSHISDDHLNPFQKRRIPGSPTSSSNGAYELIYTDLTSTAAS